MVFPSRWPERARREDPGAASVCIGRRCPHGRRARQTGARRPSRLLFAGVVAGSTLAVGLFGVGVGAQPPSTGPSTGTSLPAGRSSVPVMATGRVPGPYASERVDALALQAARTVVLTYVVRTGDTLNAIARRFGTSASTLATMNSLTNPNLIYVGQSLAVPMIVRDGSGSGVIPVVPPPGVEVVPLGSRPTTTTTTAPTTTVRPTTTTLLATTTSTLPPTTTTTLPPTTTVPVSTSVPPPPTPVSLPVSLFGSAANDPVRLALVPSFDRWSDTYRVSRSLMKGLGYVESSWRADALSSAGAVGIGQLMPDTSAWLAVYIIGDPSLDPHDPDDNIRMSARYIRWLIDQLGNEYSAIAAYYQGIGSVQRDGIQPGSHAYVARVQSARAAFG